MNEKPNLMGQLIPFDLEKALAGDPVVTRDGREVTQITVFDVSDERYRQIACVIEGRLTTYHKDGVVDLDYDSQYDLFMKPKTRTINGFEVPAPETEELDYGTEYCLATPHTDYFFRHEIWEAHLNDKLWLGRGLVFLHEEDATANAKAMLGIIPYGDSDEQV